MHAVLTTTYTLQGFLNPEGNSLLYFDPSPSYFPPKCQESMEMLVTFNLT